MLGPTPLHRRRQAGITLIEILIVLAVLGLMVGMLVVGFGAGKQAEVGRATNQIANTIRYGFDKARVSGSYYRLLIDLEDGSFTLQEGDDAMYLPATNRDGEIVQVDERKLEERADRDKRAEESFNRSVQSAAYRDDPDAAGGSGGDAEVYQAQPRKVPRRKPPLFGAFEEENTLTGLTKPVALPEGVHVSYVRTADDLEPITKGQASLYFFPRGRTQKAHIQITSDDDTVAYTIVVEPLTGRVKVVDGLEDLQLPDDIHDEKDALGRETQRRSL
ncbi:MAG: prepilin-type N-terminal cleavage/methylation domain-containing protein [Deltaproteobacteria bacterium]|nr:prepilin-type N-terminal cleavage/methylation domain-containing protein [Deltaproteobacteria bacterium]MBK8236987.1 prepilin-type N-terminal cleavage/methylation domain-containing protein [Deltaproteobacteria bacterium]MBK8719198.1 prepilin-type N-terminal cleavage/methylation domain-containing protein [Deltaproteobacteria bacterium]MBP7290865.1 prepilin-type N-terminal cleavage/methylation domain-containing protein [Nannocystaceae bacterium]